MRCSEFLVGLAWTSATLSLYQQPPSLRALVPHELMMVFLAALERDAGGSAEALAHALGSLDDLEETRRKLGEAYGGGE